MCYIPRFLNILLFKKENQLKVEYIHKVQLVSFFKIIISQDDHIVFLTLFTVISMFSNEQFNNSPYKSFWYLTFLYILHFYTRFFLHVIHRFFSFIYEVNNVILCSKILYISDKMILITISKLKTSISQKKTVWIKTTTLEL